MTASEDVAAAIRAYAAEHELGPGDRLPPERSLAATLGVSRPAVREATRRLVDLGLLRARQGSGTYVAEVDQAELFAVRGRLEPLAAELAATHARSGDRAALARLLDAMRDAVDDGPGFAALDLELHARVARASENRVLIRTLGDLDQLLRISRARTSGRRETRVRTLDDVTRLVEAIAAGDARAAGEAMTAHLLGLSQTPEDVSDRDAPRKSDQRPARG